MDRIIAKTKYSRKENKQFLFFFTMHRTSTIYFMFAFILILGVMVFSNVFQDPTSQSTIISIVLFCVTLAIIPFLFISKANEVVKQETAEKIQSTDTIEVSKYKFTRSNDMLPGKAVFGWNNIDCICENDKFIYVYNTDSTGIYIKKADIIEGTVEDFRKLAYDNLTPGKKGKINYKRYGNVRKEYAAEMRAKKAKEKELKAKNKGTK